jgi:transposase
MFIQSKYTKIFKSNDMTHLKYNELYDFAVLLCKHKNIVSKYINDNLLKYLDYTKFSFLKEMRERYKGCIPSSFDAQLYTQIFECYQNKFNVLQKNIKFEVTTFKGFEYYKKTTKRHKGGELKRVISERKQTELSICLSYLAYYGNANIIGYINSQLEKCCDSHKQRFYLNIIRCCNKFGFDRLNKLALSKRQRIIKRYTKTLIEFKSLSFSGRCRKTSIIAYNKHFGSKINAFISLSGIGRKSFDIPIKFNKDWFGNMKEYSKKTPDYEYTITFNEKEHQVNVHLYKDGKRYIPNAGNKVIGIDVNCKHNLFSLSNQISFDYDRKLVNDYCKLLTEIDKLKTSKTYIIGKRKQRKLYVMKSKMVKSEQHLIATMCKELQSQGYNHIVMEDLDNGFGKCYIKDQTNGDINYNRKVKFLGLSSLKQEVEHIARKYDIAVSTVQARYTSKMCPICGCIDDENRPNQETFECVECGHKDNADFNAAINIKNRVCEAVLRNALLKQLDNRTFEPRKLKREKVKEVLLSFRRNLQENARSERTKSRLTTFEYV